MVDSGYSVESLGGGNSLIYYAVEITNPNEYNAIVSPNIDITVLDKDGRVLTKQNRSLFAVAPGDRFFFGDAINCPKGSPADVEITVENNDYDFKTFEAPASILSRISPSVKSPKRKMATRCISPAPSPTIPRLIWRT